MESTSVKLKIVFISNNYEVLDVLIGEPESLDYLTCIAPKDEYIVAVAELHEKAKVKPSDEVEIEEDSDLQDLPKNELLVLNSDGSVQFTLKGQERIFSRISSRVIIRKAKKAYRTQSDTDFKSLGRYVFNELTRQDNRPEEFVSTPEK